MPMQELLEQANALLPDVVRLRRSIHREPELGLDLPLSQAKVLDELRGLPLDVRTGQRTTSVLADLHGGRPGRAIVLRADMDALPLQEDTGLEFASTFPGKMHACGHDGHTAMLVRTGRLVDRHQPDPPRTVHFMHK